MRLEEMITYLPPREDLMKLARYVSTIRRPARSELAIAGLVGAAIGAGVALLFSPLSGRALRDEVRARLDLQANGESVDPEI
ncbi:MAG TPA: YtxH domain-containing protein [Myxococcota bacterium]|jgi:hypothetical protein|nr:YtxH domain-containing protein [Myxococcota bacterium]